MKACDGRRRPSALQTEPTCSHRHLRSSGGWTPIEAAPAPPELQVLYCWRLEWRHRRHCPADGQPGLGDFPPRGQWPSGSRSTQGMPSPVYHTHPRSQYYRKPSKNRLKRAVNSLEQGCNFGCSTALAIPGWAAPAAGVPGPCGLRWKQLHPQGVRCAEKIRKNGCFGEKRASGPPH